MLVKKQVVRRLSWCKRPPGGDTVTLHSQFNQTDIQFKAVKIKESTGCKVFKAHCIRWFLIHFDESNPCWALGVHFSIIRWPLLDRRAQRIEIHSHNVVVSVSGVRHPLAGCRRCKNGTVDSQATCTLSHADTVRCFRSSVHRSVHKLAAFERCSHTVRYRHEQRPGTRFFCKQTKCDRLLAVRC